MSRPVVTFPFSAKWAQIGESYVLTATLQDGDFPQPIEPDADGAEITILHSGDGALTTPIVAQAMTIAGSTVSYTLAADALTSPERNLKALLDLTIDEVTYRVVYYFDAVRFSPRPPLGDAEIAWMIPGFNALRTPEDPDNGKLLGIAWEEVMGWLSDLALYPDLAVDNSQLRRGYRWKAQELLYRRAVRQPQDKFELQADAAAKEWEAWTKSAKVTIDRDSSGTVTPTEDSLGSQVVRLGRFEQR